MIVHLLTLITRKHANCQKVFSSVLVEDNILSEFNPVCDDTLVEFMCDVTDVIKVIKKFNSSTE